MTNKPPKPPKMPDDGFVPLVFEEFEPSAVRLLNDWLKEQADQAEYHKTPGDILACKIREMLVRELGRDEYNKRHDAYMEEQSNLRTQVVRYEIEHDVDLG